jgi:hypothetical protein
MKRMPGHDDDEREVQVCIEDAGEIILAAAEKALEGNCLLGDITVEVDS